MVIKIWIL